MAMLGKIMVVVFTALSLAVLTWAFGVYTQRIEFTAPAGKETPGIFKAQQAKATELSTNADRAYTRWSANLATVNTLEGERYPRRSFYSNQLELAKTGFWINPQNGQRLQQPNDKVQILVLAPNGFLDIRQHVGRPPILNRDGGQPLKSIADYDKDVTDYVAKINADRILNIKAIDERKKLNDEIVGLPEMKIKGLRQLISEQKTIVEQADLEDVFAADVVTNREAEFGLLKKRRDAMTARMDELDRDPEMKFKKKNPNDGR